jgi:hypothetical protein
VKNWLLEQKHDTHLTLAGNQKYLLVAEDCCLTDTTAYRLLPAAWQDQSYIWYAGLGARYFSIIM